MAASITWLEQFKFFEGASALETVAVVGGPFIIRAMDAYSAGPVAMDAWDGDSQMVQDGFSAGAVAIDG